MNWKKIGDYCLIALGFAAINTGGIVNFAYLNTPSAEAKKIIEVINNDTTLSSDEKKSMFITLDQLNLYNDLNTQEKVAMGVASVIGIVGTIALSFKLIGSKIEDKKDFARHIRKKEYDNNGEII